MEAFAHNLFLFYCVDPDRVQLIVEISEFPVDIQRAVPVALILNELLSNALKHAFPNGKRGSIYVRVQSEGDKCLLSVADDGIGLPSGMHLAESPSLGLQLVRVLAEQLCGHLQTVLAWNPLHPYIPFEDWEIPLARPGQRLCVSESDESDGLSRMHFQMNIAKPRSIQLWVT